ncbi:MAG: hypothetical protein ACK5UG_04370, partial [Synechococcaceae cyanobacterium]
MTTSVPPRAARPQPHPVPENADPPTPPAEAIPGLWASLRHDPLARGSWRGLAEAYTSLGFTPHGAYAAGQWQRLAGGAVEPPAPTPA